VVNLPLETGEEILSETIKGTYNKVMLRGSEGK